MSQTERRGRHTWDNELLKDWLCQSPTGAALLKVAVDNGITLDAPTKAMPKKFGRVRAAYDPAERCVYVAGDQRFSHALHSLAHELEHVRQHLAGERRFRGDLSEAKFVEHWLKLERAAETAGNRVAFDVFSLGFQRVRRAKEEERYLFREQALAYFQSRARGETHEQARAASEHLWDKSAGKKGYVDQFKAAYEDYQKRLANEKALETEGAVLLRRPSSAEKRRSKERAQGI